MNLRMPRIIGASAAHFAAIFAIVLFCAGCRPPITHGDAQLPNFQMVNDSLYRGGQPSRAGFEQLQSMGIKTVVNVRLGDTDEEFIADKSFAYLRRGMSAFTPSDEDVIWFLRIANDAGRKPVFLHCHYGADRTGYLVAMYRIVIDGWDADRAIAEMTADGNGFHPMYQNLIRYIRNADINAIRQAVFAENASESLAQSEARP